MPDLTPAERVRDRTSVLTVHAVIATLLIFPVGGAYYFITKEFFGLLIPFVPAAVAVGSFGLRLVAGVVTYFEERSDAEARSIADVTEERLR